MASFSNSYKNMNKTAQRPKATIKYSDLNTNNLNVLALEDNKLNTAQKLAMVRYKHDKYNEDICQIQSPSIKLFTYGIPREGKWYPNDKTRAFIKVPEDATDPKCMAFFSKLDEIDTMFQTSEFKVKLFGSEKVANNYKYQPIVRIPEEREDEDDAAPKKDAVPRPRFMKVKVDLDWETSKVKSKCMIKDAEGKRVPVTDIETLDDLAKYVRYRSNICMVLIANKVYASKAKVGGESKKYGITFKLSQVVCEPPTQASNDYDEDKFIDDEDVGTRQFNNLSITVGDDNDDNNLYQNTIKLDLKTDIAKIKNALDKQDEDEDDDEDNEDEEDEDDEGEESEEEVVETIPVKATKASVGRKK